MIVQGEISIEPNDEKNVITAEPYHGRKTVKTKSNEIDFGSNNVRNGGFYTISLDNLEAKTMSGSLIDLLPCQAA